MKALPTQRPLNLQWKTSEDERCQIIWIRSNLTTHRIKVKTRRLARVQYDEQRHFLATWYNWPCVGQIAAWNVVDGGKLCNRKHSSELECFGCQFPELLVRTITSIIFIFFCCLPVQVLLSLTLSIKVNDGIISALTLAATWTFVDGSCPSSCRCLHASCQIGPKTISYLWAVKINEQ